MAVVNTSPLPVVQTPFPLTAGRELLLLALMGLSVSLFTDMIVPILPDVQKDLGASATQVQQMLSLFFLSCAFMSLWHGAIADAYGRRKALFGIFLVLGVSALACLFVTRIEQLWVLRIAQGLAGGAGMIISRAIVRDLHSGEAAQRMIARMTLLQALAPIITPLLGGWLSAMVGWRSVFACAALTIMAMLVLNYRYLPETLPLDQRQPMNVAGLWRSYRAVFGSGWFMRLSVAHALNWGAMFLYAAAAPQIVIKHLGLAGTDIYWVFVAMMSGMILGFMVFPKLLRRFGKPRTIRIAYALFVCFIGANIGLTWIFSPALFHLLPIAANAFALALAMPILIADGLQPFAKNAGVASSCQMFIQFAIMAVVAGLLVPMIWDSMLHLALGNAALTLSGMALLLWQIHATRNQEKPQEGE